MLTLKVNPRQLTNGRRRTGSHISPGDYLVTVDQGIQSNGAWKPKLAKTGPSMFLAVTAALVAWVVGTQLIVDVQKRHFYQEEVNQRLLDVTRVSAPQLNSTLRKNWVLRMAERVRTNSRSQKARRTNGR